MPANFLISEHPDGQRLYAAVDPAVRFVAGRVEQSRMGAMLSPFPSVDAALAAFTAAGAPVPECPNGKRVRL